jgi:hypothetical protein
MVRLEVYPEDWAGDVSRGEVMGIASLHPSYGLTGYYNPLSTTFVGVGNRITTVINS